MPLTNRRGTAPSSRAPEPIRCKSDGPRGNCRRLVLHFWSHSGSAHLAYRRTHCRIARQCGGRRHRIRYSRGHHRWCSRRGPWRLDLQHAPDRNAYRGATGHHSGRICRRRGAARPHPPGPHAPTAHVSRTPLNSQAGYSSMPDRSLRGSWMQMKSAVLDQWPFVTAEDIASLAGEREELMRVLKARSNKSYGEIERELAEFELRDLRAGYASRPALGIGPD